MEYDPNFRTFKHVDKFAARGMVKENQREGAKAETEWEMKKSQRREFEKDMPKDNDYFRKMYMNREETAEPEMTRWLDRVKKPGDAFMQAAKKAQRREKKDIYAALQREQTEREAELANKYRDRAAERREGKGEEGREGGSGQEQPGGFFGDSFKAAGDRKQQLIEQSKYLGGDLKHTHLVKGLDYALLQKIRAEQARKEEEEMAMQEEILDTQAKSNRKLEDKDDLMQLRHPMAKNINRVLFEQERPKQIENFLEGRMAYIFELEDEYAESDIPTTLMRSKADCPDLLDNLSKSQNDVVLNKLTQILSYIRTGNKKKNKKKMDFDLEKGLDDEKSVEVKTEPIDNGFDIFSDVDEDNNKSDHETEKRKKKKDRRHRSRSRDRKERKRSRERRRSRSRDRKGFVQFSFFS